MNPLSLVRTPKPRHANYGLSLKKMGKYNYWIALWFDGRTWKAKPLRKAKNVEDARRKRDEFYAELFIRESR